MAWSFQYPKALLWPAVPCFMYLVAKLVQVSTARCIHILPFLLFEGSSSRSNSSINICSSGRVDFCNSSLISTEKHISTIHNCDEYFILRGTNSLDRGRHPFVIDEQAGWLAYSLPVRSNKISEQFRHAFVSLSVLIIRRSEGE